MGFNIERNDITKISADAIVNSANPEPVIGEGTENSIYGAAGIENLLAARKKIGKVEPGQVFYTSSFNLRKNKVRYIIHTVGDYWKDGNHGEIEILRECYKKVLNVAINLKCSSIAMPLLASGNYSYPKDIALKIAIEEISAFLFEHDNSMNVTLVVYDKDSYLVSKQQFDDVKSFIDENYIDNYTDNYIDNYGDDADGNTLNDSFKIPENNVVKELDIPSENLLLKAINSKRARKMDSSIKLNSLNAISSQLLFEKNEEIVETPVIPKKKSFQVINEEDLFSKLSKFPGKKSELSEISESDSLKFESFSETLEFKNVNESSINEYLQETINQNFQNTLQFMIAERNLENAFVYNKAGLDRRYFSKIISKKDYVPVKQTVMALGLALELSLEDFEKLLTSAGYAFMPSSKFDLIVKYCVLHSIYNLIEVDCILSSQKVECFSHY